MELTLTATDDIILDFFKLRMLSYQAHCKIGFAHSMGKVSFVISGLNKFLNLSSACEAKILELSQNGLLWTGIMNQLENFVEQNIVKSRILRVNCVLASPVLEDQAKIIESNLNEFFSDKVIIINFETDASIIGGCQIEICGNMFDYSYAKRFNLLRNKILECLEDYNVH